MQSSGLSNRLFVDTTFAWLLLLMFLLGGAIAYQSMLRENNPDLEIPQALVITEWAGASAEQIEKQITKPLEDKIRSLKGLKKLQSGSQNSFAILAVEFNSSIELTEAMNLLRAKVDEAQADFPQQAKKPKIEQVSVNDTPILEYVLYGEIDDHVLSEVTKTLKREFESLAGIKKVDLGGERESSVHVRLLPDRIKTLGISPLLIQQRIEKANHDMAWGEFDDGSEVWQLYLEGRFNNIEQLKQLPIQRVDENRLIRLHELAHVSIDLDQKKSSTYFSEAGTEFEKGVSFSIVKRPGSDTITTIEKAKALMVTMPEQSFWPQGLEYALTADESEIIHESFNNIVSNILQAMVAVFIILLLLLTWREALIAGIAIPVTFLAVLAVLYMMGYTLNTMVIIGMVLALGLLVDVFILVMEGMHEAIFTRKLSFAKAAMNTVRTFIKPAFAGQLTTILAMAPMMAIGGIDGKFIRLIPVTTVLSLIMSFVIAFLICIPLSRLLLSNKHGAGETVMDKLTATVTGRLKIWLRRYPLKSKGSSMAWVVSAFGVLVLALFAATQLPSELYPKADGRNLGITIELSPSASLEQTEKVAEIAGEYLRQQPYFSNVVRYAGQKSPYSVGSLKEQLLPTDGSHLVGLSALFTPKSERERMAYEYLPDIRQGLEKALAHVPGLTIIFTPQTGGSTSDDPIQIAISGADMHRLSELSREVQQLLASINEVTDVRDNLGYWRPQVRTSARAEALSFYGLSEDELSAQLRLATEADEYGKFKVEGVNDDLPIRISSWWESRAGAVGGPREMSEASLINIITSEGKAIPLTSVMDYQIVQVPTVYTHDKGRRTVIVQAKIGQTTVGQVLAELQPMLDKAKTNWGQGYDYRFGGEAESSAETYGSAGQVFFLAIFMVFAVLALLFNSFKQPIVILLTIPLALIGTFGGFYLLGIAFSFPAMIGLISLVGIVVNNAIVMIETMNSYRQEGMSLVEAASSGAADRLRPIIGTTATTTVGLIPLALSDPMWYPLCMAIILGLIASTITAMVIIPAMYRLLTKES
ncbi:efflux RND transporter permease subunit [Pleionea sp. CnH1-48]|uniref:efflux RND transporter permease subunit n=1 Tax=Pleionea sp. CnH1-48 TaxID=2954494 RepID=UPI00209784D6|nr:efflux RND transporter permease subunit [Pleionea sp. CnH1-48]